MEKVAEVIKRVAGNPSLNQEIIPNLKICEDISKRDELLRQLNLSLPLKTFGNFKESNILTPVKGVFRGIADGKDDRVLLFCFGSSGCGKTHLLKATALRLYGRHIFCRYLEWYKIIQTLKSGFDKNAVPSYEQRLDNYCKARALLIDDYGLGSTNTDWEKSQLEIIINARYEYRLLTIITTNLSNDEIPERVISRFRDCFVGQIIVNRAGDYRREGLASK